eukprot:COSAG01_NODE_662_length_14431_cov_31.385775_11_plen_97_part_00
MLENTIKLLYTLLADPYGFLFLVITLLFIVLFIFKKITRLLFLILLLISIYLGYMFISGQPVPEVSNKLKDPILKEFKELKKWSKKIIWEQAQDKT